MRKRNNELLNLTPEERYLMLLKERPKVMERILQQYIASYRTGIKGFFATPNNGGDNETYLFNYSHVGVGAKYHPFSKTFNKGLFVKTSFGIGQMTEKMPYNNTQIYEHQFAIGTTILGGVGYSIPILKNKAALNIDLDAEYSFRRGDVTGKAQINSSATAM